MVNIRPGHTGDMGWLRKALSEAGWGQMVPRESAAAWPGAVAQQTEGMLRRILQLPGGTLLVAESGTQPIGYIVFYIQPNPLTTELEGMMAAVHVHPEWRRRGVATGLVARAEEQLSQNGARAGVLITSLYHPAALSLFARRGYCPERVLLGRRFS